MKLADRLNLSSVNMAIRLNFNDLLKRINAAITRLVAVEETLEDGVVTSFLGDTGDITGISLDGANLSGTLDLDLGGTNADLSADGLQPRTAGNVYAMLLEGDDNGVTTRVLDMSDIATGNLATSRLSGTVALANGGTAADLSATGGASQVLKQVTAGGAVTVGTLASADLSDSNSLVYQTGYYTDALFEGDEPLWDDTTNTIRTKCYLRAKAAAANDVFGVFVPHKLRLSGITFSRTTVGSESTTNCSIITKDCDEYGIKFEIEATAAGDCYAEATYAVRPNAA